jgi:PhnB protein
MARTSTHLNFSGRTGKAFGFHRTVSGTAFTGPIQPMSDAPRPPRTPEMSAAEKNLVMHVELPITGGHAVMGTEALAAGGKVTMPLQEMFQGACHGALTDRFDVQRMVNCAERALA